MEDEALSDQLLSVSRSESEMMAGEKRGSAALREKSELSSKRLKMRDVEPVTNSQEIREANHHFFSAEVKSREVSKDNATTESDVAQPDVIGQERRPIAVDPASRVLDLNTKVSISNNSAGGHTLECTNKLSFGKHDAEHDVNSRGFGWDLNAEDVSSSLNQDPFYPYKSLEHLKSYDVSECGSTTGPLEENDSMRVWKEMKQNGFLSSFHKNIPVPRPRGRKSKSDGLKRRMELAKREQVDRFARVAAPSGLLNELNPGIINHVRNSKQVHSIIEALVRSEKRENRLAGGKQAIPTKSGAREIGDRKEMESASGLVINQLGLPRGDRSVSTSSLSHQVRCCPKSMSQLEHLNSDHSGRHGDLSKLEGGNFGKITYASRTNQDSEDDILALKLSSISTTMMSENASSLSNEDSANPMSVSSLSFKAADVANEWLELLHQDIKGRLAALRRSKKRIRAVIQTELPFLMSREFFCDQENDPSGTSNSAARCSDNANAAAHRARWSALFGQMDKALSEEEKQLESWLNQVREMQFHCQRGLQHFHHNLFPGSEYLGISENDSRLLEEAESSERKLAVRAAAASIYSTCNFLLSMENPSCF
ncbi:hypothetical protein NMG60_11012077 [Bertholletia excelsa]